MLTNDTPADSPAKDALSFRADRLLEERKLRGLTLNALAELLGLSDGSQISRWESGKATPSLFRVSKLCEIFNKERSYFTSTSAQSSPQVSRSTIEDVASDIFVTESHKHILVFLSHSSEDTGVADRYAEMLTDAGFSVVSSVPSRPGTDLSLDNLERQIRDCYFFLLLVSASSVQSELVQRELGLAAEMQRLHGGYKPVIIPIFVNASVEVGAEGYHVAFPMRKFQTREEEEHFILDIRRFAPRNYLLDEHKAALLSLMRPRLLVSRYNFTDESVFDDTDVFSLYESLFPKHERDSRDDIITWVLRTDLGNARRVQLPNTGLLEYTLDSRYFIMTLAGKAIGLGFFTYDHSTELAYGNYIAVQQSWRSTHLAGSLLNKIVEVLGNLFPNYRGVVFEVEKLDRDRLNDVIYYLEGAGDKKFRSPDDRDVIRKFLRVSWYLRIGAVFFKDNETEQPAICRSPCLDPSSDDWASEEDDFWLMWLKRPETTTEWGEKTELWEQTVRCIYIEILAKSLVEAYPEQAEKYWEYANVVVEANLNQRAGVSFGRYLHRHDDNLMSRWVKLRITDMAI